MMEYVQNDIFSELYPKFTITKPIRLIELFAGIGSQAKALVGTYVRFDFFAETVILASEECTTFKRKEKDEEENLQVVL